MDCTGVLQFYEKYKKQMDCFRCVACRKVRHRLQNQSYKPKPDYKERCDNLKYQDSLKTKQIERLKRKVSHNIFCLISFLYQNSKHMSNYETCFNNF